MLSTSRLFVLLAIAGTSQAGLAQAGASRPPYDLRQALEDQLKHLAAANWQLGSKALGVDPPSGTHDEQAPASVRSKAEILDYLRGSFACLHRAAAAIDQQNAMQPIPGLSGTWQRTRLGLIIDALAHSSDHYGQIVEYLRANSIVPPASR